MATNSRPPADVNEEELDADAVLAELEADESTDPAYREQRTNEFLQDASGAGKTNSASFMPASTKQEAFVTLKSDDDTLRFTTEHDRAIVHFFHSDFARCSIMDEHLDRIADRHGVYGGTESGGEDIAFARVNVEDAPFVVERLGVRVLPCVIGFVNGVVKGKVIGFEGVCWDGKEKDIRVSKALEESFVSWKVLKKITLDDVDDDDSEPDEERRDRNQRPLNGRRGIKGRKQEITDEDDDWD